MRLLNEITVHCAATDPEWMEGRSTLAKVNAIRRWHVVDNGWNDIGYHYVIDRDGTVADGRDIAKVGAHVKGHNAGKIGICLIGGKWSNERDDFFQNFTKAQSRALYDLISRLLKSHPGISRVSGHNEYANRACPGFSVPAWYADARRKAVYTKGDPSRPKGLVAQLFEFLASLFGAKS